jgi:hypothetical protein
MSFATPCLTQIHLFSTCVGQLTGSAVAAAEE